MKPSPMSRTEAVYFYRQQLAEAKARFEQAKRAVRRQKSAVEHYETVLELLEKSD